MNQPGSRRHKAAYMIAPVEGPMDSELVVSEGLHVKQCFYSQQMVQLICQVVALAIDGAKAVPEST